MWVMVCARWTCRRCCRQLEIRCDYYEDEGAVMRDHMYRIQRAFDKSTWVQSSVTTLTHAIDGLSPPTEEIFCPDCWIKLRSEVSRLPAGTDVPPMVILVAT